MLHAGYPFAYLRGETHLVVVNPRREAASLDLPLAAGATPLLTHGARVVEGGGAGVELDGFGYGIFTLAPDTSS